MTTTIKLNNFLLNFEHRLKDCLNDLEDSRVKDAMKYALEGQGKRFRPALLFLSSNVLPDHSDVIEVACALEMIHTYSLVHDDLPSMDNDDYRRGRLTTHKKFDEATAVLAGDALLTEAFNMIANTQIDDLKKIKIISILSKAAGANGMILGQDLDMLNDAHINFDETNISRMYALKTGALFGASLAIGALFQDREEDIVALQKIGFDMGIVFQIQDDYLEATSTFETLGKSTQSDAYNHKQTLVSLWGLDHSSHIIAQSFQQLVHAIIKLHENYGPLVELIETMQQRKK